MELAVIQHNPWEGPGRYLEQVAKEKKVTLTVIRAWKGKFPDPYDFAGFIFLGGTTVVGNSKGFPFLRKEREYLKNQLLETDRPCLGICLGYQLLAEAFGVTVMPHCCRIMDTGESLLTRAGRDHPVFRGFTGDFPTLAWHKQSVLPPLPSYFDILATSKDCQVEAFSIATRPYVVGIQFDNHAAHPDDISRWYQENRQWIDSMEPHHIDVEELLSTMREAQKKILHDFKLFFSNFLEFCH